MSVEAFWRSSPRIANLVVEGYRRRRAWAAFHAGYGTAGKTFEQAELGDLLGRSRAGAPEPMNDEALLQNIRRWRIVTGARKPTERTPPDVE